MKTRLIRLLCLFAFLLPALACAEYKPFNLPKDLQVIGDSAFQNTPGSYVLQIPDGVTRIRKKAFAGTEIAILVFQKHPMPYDSVQKDSFDWDSMTTVHVWKGDAGNPDRERDLYDFFEEIQSAQAKKGKKLQIYRTDPYLVCSSNTAVALKGTKAALSAKAENLPFTGVSWQWQESRDGKAWTDCAGGEADETAEDRDFSFVFREGMAPYYRCTATYENGDHVRETRISENEIEIRFIREEDLNWNLTAEASGTAVKLSWNPDLKGLVPFAVYMAAEVSGPEGSGYTALSLVENELSDTEYTVELLKPDTNYLFAVSAVTPGEEILEEAYVTTEAGPAEDKTVYRALLIGEVDFPGDFCSRNFADVKMMRSMLRQAKGASKGDASGGAMYGVTVKKDLNRQGILDAIQEAFGDADKNDVSLFFIATHGDVEDKGEQAGRLCTVTGSMEDDDLLLKDLAEALLDVNGEVVVFLESCGSGAAVVSDEEAESMDGKRNQDGRAFTEAAVRAFARAEEEAAELSPRTGELREKKFHVLTAAAYHQYAWGWEGDENARNYFPEHLVEGVLKGAELNGKGEITLEALYRYIQRVGDAETYIDWDENGNRIEYHQNVQVWPEDCGDPLFVRME